MTLDNLTVRTVPQLWEQRTEIFAISVADLSQLKEIDSAGIAFLVQWAKARTPQRLQLRAVPERARRLIQTFKVEPLFELI